MPIAGWYDDPWLLGDLRWWDGHAWTAHTYEITTADEIAVAPEAEPMARRSGDPRPADSHLSPSALRGLPIDLALRPPGAGALAMDAVMRGPAPKQSWFTRFFRLPPPPTPKTSWGVGAEGEIIVGRCLATLGADWRTLHSVSVGRHGADIDHIVIGPPGVFTINTKHHPRSRVTATRNAVFVGNSETDYFAKSRIEAERAERLLTRACQRRVTVSPMIAVISRQLFLDGYSDVAVVNAGNLVAWLRTERAQISPSEVISIFEHARQSSTWQ